MSQVSSQVGDPSWTSIPFAKFSHNTSPQATRNFVWTHVGARNDLDLIVRDMKVVDAHGNYASRLIMRVTAGSDTLEMQDLGDLVRFSREFNPATTAEHPVQVVVKSPFLAMRYPKANNEVRRIQLKFHTAVDFNRAMQILIDLGLPITDSPPITTTRPIPSPTPSTFSSTSASSSVTLGHLLARPSSMQESARIVNSLTSPLRSDFKIPMPPGNSRSDLSRSSSAQPYAIKPMATPSSFNGAIRQLSSLYASQVDRDSPKRKLSHPTFPAPDPSDQNGYSNQSLFVSQMQAQHATTSDQVEGSDRFLTMSPFFPPPNAINSMMQPSADHGPFFHDQPKGPALHIVAASNPSSAHHDRLSEFVLPPVRELPFPKYHDPAKTRCSSASDLPPLPKPTPVKRSESSIKLKGPTVIQAPTPAPSHNKKRVAQRKAPANQLPQRAQETEQTFDRPIEDATVLLNPVTPVDESSPLAAKSAAAIRPASAASGLQSKAASTKKRPAIAAPVPLSSATKRPKMLDQSTQTEGSSDCGNSTSFIPSTRTIDVRPIAPPSPPEDYLTMVDAFVTKHKARPAPNELWEVPGYAALDEEERHALLNEFICANLENEDFIQLCQDTEWAWRKIGLGM